MQTTNAPLFSLILPCYNESGALDYLFKEYGPLSEDLKGQLEVIFVNNGSSDNTAEIYQQLIKNYEKFSTNFIYHCEKINKGVGGGLKAGARIAKGKFLIFCHADEQYGRKSVELVLEKFKNLSEQEKQNTLIKGVRRGRSFKEFAISRGFDAITSLRSLQNYYDINAQPKFFLNPGEKFWENAPDDYCIDVFVLYSFKKLGFKTLSVIVPLQNRKSGKSSWSRSWSSVYKLSKRYIGFVDSMIRDSKKGDQHVRH